MVEVVAFVTCKKNLPKHLENLKGEAAQLGFDETELEFPKGFSSKGHVKRNGSWQLTGTCSAV